MSRYVISLYIEEHWIPNISSTKIPALPESQVLDSLLYFLTDVAGMFL